MKKAFMIITIILVAATAASAQSTRYRLNTSKGTLMSQSNNIDYGGALGYGGGKLGGLLYGVIDINFKDSGFRIREQGGLMEIKPKPCLFAGIDAQYLFHTIGNIFIYPTAGFYCEYHNTEAWRDEDGTMRTWGAGFQAGFGAEYQFSSNFGIFGEAREQFMLNVSSRPMIDVGVIIHIGNFLRK